MSDNRRSILVNALATLEAENQTPSGKAFVHSASFKKFIAEISVLVGMLPRTKHLLSLVWEEKRETEVFLVSSHGIGDEEVIGLSALCKRVGLGESVIRVRFSKGAGRFDYVTRKGEILTVTRPYHRAATASKLLTDSRLERSERERRADPATHNLVRSKRAGARG